MPGTQTEQVLASLHFMQLLGQGTHFEFRRKSPVPQLVQEVIVVGSQAPQDPEHPLHAPPEMTNPGTQERQVVPVVVSQVAQFLGQAEQAPEAPPPIITFPGGQEVQAEAPEPEQVTHAELHCWQTLELSL